MRKRLNTDELEEYLQDVADGHRLYPSSHIWTNIQDSLHGRPKWPALTFVALFIITALVVGTILIKPDQQLLNVIASASQPSQSIKTAAPANNLADHINAENITTRTLKAVTVRPAIIVQTEPDDQQVYQPVEKQNIQQRSVEIKPISDKILADLPEQLPLTIQVIETASTLSNKENNSTSIEENIKADRIDEAATTNLLSNFATPPIKIAKAKRNRWEMDYYITPSGSYRRLIDDNKSIPVTYTPSIPLQANYELDVNKVVRHKPAMGMEIGVNVGYHVTNDIILKTGVQFNVREYDINAFAYGYENAQINLSNGTEVNTINSLSRYRNNNGSTPVTLKNIYHELSVPVGIEIRKSLGRNLTWGVGAAVQPTYVFSKQPFVITSNYKNYTEGTALVRNWNVNTSLQGYIGYKIGDYQWHLGPQFRYQQLPSFSNSYHIREYLFDYGVRLGFTKTIK